METTRTTAFLCRYSLTPLASRETEGSQCGENVPQIRTVASLKGVAAGDAVEAEELNKSSALAPCALGSLLFFSSKQVPLVDNDSTDRGNGSSRVGGTNTFILRNDECGSSK